MHDAVPALYLSFGVKSRAARLLMVTSVTSSSLRVIASSIGWRGKAESNGAPEGNRVTAGVLRPAGDTSP